MIDYFKGIYGTNLLRRVHGSALYRGSLVGLLSVFVYLLIALRWNANGRHRHLPGLGEEEREHRHRDGGDGGDLNDPYGVGVLVSSVTFLIVFRANTGYQRYWEACNSLHHFLSKSSDAAMHTATFHLQSRHYDGIRPIDFHGHRVELDGLNLEAVRTRGKNGGRSRGDDDNRRGDECARDGGRGARVLGGRMSALTFPAAHDDVAPATATSRVELHSRFFPSSRMAAPYDDDDDGDGDDDATNFACRRPNNGTPPLFLQELAHLSSLACAVALSTLRNDESVSRYESPLDAYVPGSAWPAVDPDAMPRRLRDDFQHRLHPLTLAWYWLGLDRLPHWRARYNAARPLHVLGGVSDSEARQLRRARGSHAKTELASSWLKEFIVRESLAGSLGDVHTSIISRVVQNFSDAMVGYYQARKVTYIPFPFPHAQLCAFFTLVMVFAVPFMMDQYAGMPWTGSTLTFLTVTCLVGLHEVARELENPFRNVPNEIPLCALQASYNETLVTMFGGYNPDALLWDPKMVPARRGRRGDRGGESEDDSGSGKDRERHCDVMGIRNTTTMITTIIEEMPTTHVTESMTSMSSSVMECQPMDDDSECDDDARASVVGIDGSEHDVAKKLLEDMLAKQVVEVQELYRLLDNMEEVDKDGCNTTTMTTTKIEDMPTTYAIEPMTSTSSSVMECQPMNDDSECDDDAMTLTTARVVGIDGSEYDVVKKLLEDMSAKLAMQV
ncbi:hypothetical protein ACHAW5_004699 [Stephanodiscus triporus]|uniref:Bestrophin homolog n=1 Tax=Stephanodiscus triporus TaxID=2934178 RepID=A0ABD3MJN6_9STRA